MGDHAGIVSDVRFAPPVSSTDSVAAVGGTTDKAFIAQMVERKTLNLVVVGSSPTVGIPFCHLFVFCTSAQLP